MQYFAFVKKIILPLIVEYKKKLFTKRWLKKHQQQTENIEIKVSTMTKIKLFHLNFTFYLHKHLKPFVVIWGHSEKCVNRKHGSIFINNFLSYHFIIFIVYEKNSLSLKLIIKSVATDFTFSYWKTRLEAWNFNANSTKKIILFTWIYVETVHRKMKTFSCRDKSMS